MCGDIGLMFTVCVSGREDAFVNVMIAKGIKGGGGRVEVWRDLV